MERIERLADDVALGEHLHRKQQRKIVQEALEILPQKHREVLVLMELEERPAKEVAEMLGVPPGTIYSRLHYARRAFSKGLKRHHNVQALGLLLEGWGGAK